MSSRAPPPPPPAQASSPSCSALSDTPPYTQMDHTSSPTPAPTTSGDAYLVVPMKVAPLECKLPASCVPVETTTDASGNRMGYMLSLPYFNCSVWPHIMWRVLGFTLWSAIIYIFHLYVISMPSFLSEKVHSLIGVAIGLLLVFRTNTAYDRFWEGRRQWGLIILMARDITRLSLLLPNYFQARDRVSQLCIATGLALKQRLRVSYSMKEIEGVLSPATCERVDLIVKDALAEKKSTDPLAVVNMPLIFTQMISQWTAHSIREANMSVDIQVHIERLLDQLNDSCAACERVMKTLVPHLYVLHLRHMVFFYLVTFPFCMNSFLYGMIIATFFMSFAMFGIEEVATKIENPFGTDQGDLPQEGFLRSIYNDVRLLEQLALDPLVVPQKPSIKVN